MNSKASAATGGLGRLSRGLCWSAVVAFAVVAAPAFAHHSASMFDMAKTVEVKGTVKRFEWTNPHTLLILDAVDGDGKAAELSFEANGPGYLQRTGWKRESLKPGDKVTIIYNPLRDGGSGGNLVTAVLPDGRELSAKPVGPNPYAGEAAPKAAGSSK